MFSFFCNLFYNLLFGEFKMTNKKRIEYINPKYKDFTDQKLYENANHALNRTPGFVKWDKKNRK